jgi:hypothetical protein
VDSYHAHPETGKKGKLFWQDMPNRTYPFDLSRLPRIYEKYEQICALNKGTGGFFDVLAWREGRIIFIEFKSKEDKSNKNEPRWIDSALGAGIPESDLYFALYQPGRLATQTAHSTR